jgi:phage-related protein (TIGR01555 family)
MKPGAPSVNPSGGKKRVQRRDGWINAASGHGTSTDRRTLTRFGVDVVTDLEAMQLWRSEWLAKKIIEKRPQEIFRRGIEIKTDKAKPEDIAEVIGRSQELELEKRCVLAEQYRTAFGGAAIFAAMDGAIGELSEPLDEDHIQSVNALHVLEPRELQPVTYYQDLNSPKFGRPETYRLMPLTTGRVQTALMYTVVHETRLVIFNGTRVSKQTQPGQRESWGDSALSPCWTTLSDYGLSWGSAATILHEYGHGILQMDGLAELLATNDGVNVVNQRLAIMEMYKSSLHAMTVDGKDTFTRASMSLAGLADVLEQNALVVAAAAGYPVTVLLGMAPAGLSATGDNDVRNWYADVENYRNTETKPAVEQLLRWIMKSTDGPLAGKEPEVWCVEFPPLWTPSEKEEAETRKIVADTDVAYVNAGIAFEEDVARSRWGGNTYSADMAVDWAAYDKRKKESEAKQEMFSDAMLRKGPPTEDAPPKDEDHEP